MGTASSSINYKTSSLSKDTQEKLEKGMEDGYGEEGLDLTLK